MVNRAFLVLLLLVSVPLHAEPKPVAMMAPVVAIIDVQRILQESLAAKSVQKQLEVQRAKFQAEISEQEKQLQAADDQLKEARTTTAPDTLATREQQLRLRFTEVERDVQTKRHALDDSFATSMGVVRTSLLDVVQEVAKQRGITLVLLKQQALWHDPALDMTGEVLNKLNAKLTEVPVKIQLPPPESGSVADKTGAKADAATAGKPHE
jgi:Skp family chaperone for outer membrane proteins